MASRRRVVPLVTLSMVTGVHLVIIWLLMSSPQLMLKTKSGSLQLVWLPQPAKIDAAPERAATNPRSKTGLAQKHADRMPAPSSPATQSNEQDNAVQLMPDWNQELRLAAKSAVANQLTQKRHDFDFAHAFPVSPQKPPQFAWDYAATHRVESMPAGGIVVHISDNCVLIFFPLPFVGCGIGKRPANGDIFEHLQDR